jgi:hypothetical protein
MASFFASLLIPSDCWPAGKDKEIPRAAVVKEPYDSLGFVPTILALTVNLRDDSSPVLVLRDRGFRQFPGRIVKELLAGTSEDQEIAVVGVTTAP